MRIAVVAALALSWPIAAHAQDRPFVFSVTTAGATAPQMRVDYDFGAGEQTFHPDVQNGPEQRIGLQASAGRFTFVGHVGVDTAGSTYETSNQGELLFSLTRPRANGFSLAVGAGMEHEAAGDNVLRSRIAAGRETTHTTLQGNVLLQHAFAPGRAPAERRWQVTVAGGPTLHPTLSPRTSDAIRELPQTTRPGTGYAARVAFAVTF